MKRHTLVIGTAMLGIFLLSGCSTSNNNPTTNHNTSNSAKMQSQDNEITATHANTKNAETSNTSQQLKTMYQAIASVPQTPQAFVDAYMAAIGTGSGLYARAYLSSSIQDQLPTGRIAGAGEDTPSHSWLVKWTVQSIDTTTKGMNAENTLQATAYAYQPKTGNLISVFQDKLTVTSGNVASPLNDTPPYYITAQSVTWLHPNLWNHF